MQRHKEAASEKQNKMEMFYANSEVRRRGHVIGVNGDYCNRERTGCGWVRGTKKEVEREGEGTHREEGLQDLEVDEGTVEWQDRSALHTRVMPSRL